MQNGYYYYRVENNPALNARARKQNTLKSSDFINKTAINRVPYSKK